MRLSPHERPRRSTASAALPPGWICSTEISWGECWFPWEGKSFQSRGKDEGSGINRVRLGGRHRLFPFRTHFGPSVIDGQPALVLDYDDPDNPGVIRAIHDEVREVAPGLYFGPACLKKKAGGTSTALWFALDARGVSRAARPS